MCTARRPGATPAGRPALHHKLFDPLRFLRNTPATLLPAVRVYQELDVETHRAPGPSTLDAMTELPRVFLEASALAYLWPLLARSPRGDGHPVLVLPGFTAGDESTGILRRFLARLGYDARPWGLGQNTPLGLGPGRGPRGGGVWAWFV